MPATPSTLQDKISGIHCTRVQTTLRHSLLECDKKLKRRCSKGTAGQSVPKIVPNVIGRPCRACCICYLLTHSDIGLVRVVQLLVECIFVMHLSSRNVTGRNVLIVLQIVKCSCERGDLEGLSTHFFCAESNSCASC